MSRNPFARSGSAVRNAQRAITSALPHLSPADLFLIAAIAERLGYGEDRGNWLLSREHARAALEAESGAR
jgi:hypothetical protein